MPQAALGGWTSDHVDRDPLLYADLSRQEPSLADAIVFGEDRRLADLLIGELKDDASLNVGINEPYSPADQVYYTVERHAGPSGLPAAMIEIRNDEIRRRIRPAELGRPAGENSRRN